MFGAWNVKVSVSAMPQKVATAVGKLSEQLIGAEYQPIAYLGSQEVNGINHAVLAEQTVLTGRDSTNIVILVFNEKDNDCTLVNIERVVESGAPLGGTTIKAVTDIPADVKAIWDGAFEDRVGVQAEPFAFLGTQVVKGTNYIFAATIAPVVPDARASVAIVTVNPMTKTAAFADLLENKQTASLGYAFTWLRGKALGAPLGEWP